MLSTLIVPSTCSKPLSSVDMIRSPVIPNGWPIAMPPPNGLTRSSKGSIPTARQTGMTSA